MLWLGLVVLELRILCDQRCHLVLCVYGPQRALRGRHFVDSDTVRVEGQESRLYLASAILADDLAAVGNRFILPVLLLYSLFGAC